MKTSDFLRFFLAVNVHLIRGSVMAVILLPCDSDFEVEKEPPRVFQTVSSDFKRSLSAPHDIFHV